MGKKLLQKQRDNQLIRRPMKDKRETVSLPFIIGLGFILATVCAIGVRRKTQMIKARNRRSVGEEFDFEQGFDSRVYPVYQFEGVEGGYPQYQADFRQYGDQYMQAQVYDHSVVLQQSNVQQMQVQSAPIEPVKSKLEIPPAPVTVEVKPIPVQSQELKKVEPVTSKEPQVVEKLEFKPKEEPVVAVSTTIKPPENGDVSEFDWKYNEELDEALAEYDFDHSIPNANFIFHNKLPKSGSTTMHDILRELSQKNLFYYKKMDSSNMNFDDDESLTDYIRENMKKPFFYMQHHFFTNFTKYDIDQPTMINVIREPIDWFSSHYHFKLYGWSRKPGQRGDQNEMTLEECINTNAPTCARNHWRYIEFFCGNGPECQQPSNPHQDEQIKSRMVAVAKQRMMQDYFIVGVLEQFEDSLRVFEKLLPRYYRGALDVYQSKTIQTTRNQTKSLNKKTLPDIPMRKLREGTLKHEYDLYHFARQLFNERMKDLKLERYQREEL